MKEERIIQGDCLIEMQKIPDKSIDMILCDLPYGTTACKWDTIIPFEPLWEQYKRIIKDNGAIVLTASQPFTSALVMSNVKMFKYEWIWEKAQGTNFFQAKQQPLKTHENILVFSQAPASFTSKGNMTYNPQKTTGKPYEHPRKIQTTGGANFTFNGTGKNTKALNGYIVKSEDGSRFPKSVLRINKEVSLHPTQKPVALFEYLIKTYTNEGDLVLDNCAGSGTTGVACKNLNRNFIGIELDENYFKIAKERIEKTPNKLTL